MQLLPSLLFICLEYFVERLINVVISQTLLPSHAGIPQVGRYLIVTSDGEGTVVQLFGRKVRQDIGYISRNIGSGGE